MHFFSRCCVYFVINNVLRISLTGERSREKSYPVVNVRVPLYIITAFEKSLWGISSVVGIVTIVVFSCLQVGCYITGYLGIGLFHEWILFIAG